MRWGGGGWAVAAALLFIAAARSPAQLPGDATCDGTLGPDDLPAIADAFFADGAADCPVTDGNGDGAPTAADLVWSATTVAGPQPAGPVSTFFGLATADGVPSVPVATMYGADVFVRNTGSGFQVIVEGRAGLSGEAPGLTMLNSEQDDPTMRPDLQILSNAPLGDGSRQVCSGGVPAIDPPNFGPSQAVADALNDLGCRFVPVSNASPCTVDEFGRPRFVRNGTQAQYCVVISRQQLEFPRGDTVLTLRLRDTGGQLGPARQMVVRVGAPLPSPTPTLAPTPTATPSVTWSPTSSPTPPPTATRSSGPTTITAGPSATSTRTASVTPSPGGPTGSPTRTPTATRTPTPGPSASATATGGRTPTATVSRSPTRTPTATRTLTRTATRTPTPSTTPTPSDVLGPRITFFGLARADETLIDPVDSVGDIPIYVRTAGFGFYLVVEGRPGASGAALGRSAFDSSGADFPDLQVVVSRPMGANPSAAVCDRGGVDAGGVPPTDPPTFDPVPTVIDAVNDLACRFRDGADAPLGRGSGDSCVYFEATSTYHFVTAGSTLQFCGFVDGILRFQPGDTVVTARLRDVEGNVGAPGQLIVRVP